MHIETTKAREIRIENITILSLSRVVPKMFTQTSTISNKSEYLLSSSIFYTKRSRRFSNIIV